MRTLWLPVMAMSGIFFGTRACIFQRSGQAISDGQVNKKSCMKLKRAVHVGNKMHVRRVLPLHTLR